MPSPTDRLLIVSNRLPLTARRSAGGWRSVRSNGGLVAVLAPLLREGPARWLGWPGDPGEGPDADPEQRRGLLEKWEREEGFVAVDLPAATARAFYEGFANATLWPLLHGFSQRAVIDPETWPAYVEANERFAEAITARLAPGDRLWVHDYQLLLVPELVRRTRPDAAIGFFLHVPFPSSEVFRILPQREALLRGMLGADLLAFQTPLDLHGFRRALLQVLGIESRMDRVDVDGRTVRLEAIPIGIVGAEWERLLGDASVHRRITELRGTDPGRKLVLAVDRLDDTKGIPERLRAFRRLLRRSAQRRGKLTLIQVAIPTRERVARYRELRREVSELVAEIDGEFGTPEWTPVVYILRAVPPTELAALYAVADVAWVSPLRDGMNLVAKEYVACQVERPGALLISEFAGAAQELGEALRVNPYDELGSVEALERALDMPEDERRERMEALRRRVAAGDAEAWRARFLRSLDAAVEDREAAISRSAPPLPVEDLVTAFRTSGDRLVCLDYDGTLVPIVGRPEEAAPTSPVLDVLRALTALPDTTVVVVSGRDHDELDRWLGDVPGLWLAAEHGALLRRGGSDWTALHPGAYGDWKRSLRPLLDEMAERVPGSLVEEKSLALAWHYRLADREFGTWMANELATTLDLQLAGTDLAVLRGRKVVEVRFAWATKGEVMRALRDAIGTPGLVLAIGDDRTDEDLFEQLHGGAWTVKVGRTRTRARWRVDGPDDVLALLASLAGGDGARVQLAPASARTE